jgi:flagellin
MSFTINTNVAALNTLFSLNVNQSAMNKASLELSSGYKINSAADDAAGLAISTKMNNQITGLNRATQNAQDGLSMLQTMEGGVSSIESMLGRMRDLALEAANGTSTTSDRAQIMAELNQLQAEINRTAQSTQFNTKTLLTGIGSAGITFQVGANAKNSETISLKASNAGMLITKTANKGLSLFKSLSSLSTKIAGANTLSQQAAASALVANLDKVLSNVSKFRANIGAVEDRLNFAITNLSTESNNLSTANSRIMDTNMAQTMTQYSKNQILVNAGISMLAQANQTPGMVLKLLG